jgi:DNA-binding PadR family transcriptional regulator
VRSAILALLTERPMNGYEMMGELESRSGGAWRPSPGALYPALQALEDEALIAAQTSDGKRQFELTDAGREVSTAGDAQRPWEQFAANVPPANKLLRDRVGQIVLAVRQVAEVATEEQKAEATQILTDARKALYQLLADSE